MKLLETLVMDLSYLVGLFLAATAIGAGVCLGIRVMWSLLGAANG